MEMPSGGAKPGLAYLSLFVHCNVLSARYTPLSLECTEAVSVATLVRQSTVARILSIQRVQNRAWWRGFALGCREVSLHCARPLPRVAESGCMAGSRVE